MKIKGLKTPFKLIMRNADVQRLQEALAKSGHEMAQEDQENSGWVGVTTK